MSTYKRKEKFDRSTNRRLQFDKSSLTCCILDAVGNHITDTGCRIKARAGLE